MIFTERKVTVINDNATIDRPLIIYRGDKNIELKITIAESQFKFRNNDASNVIESTDASYAQLVITTPYGSPIFSDVAATKNGAVIFVITEGMVDEIREIGTYSFQIRLLDDNKQSRVTIPPVNNAIEIKAPLAVEDGSAIDSNTVNTAMAGYAATTYSTPLEAFDSQGNYIKTTWGEGDRITDAALNKIEAGIDGVNKKVASGGTSGEGMTQEQVSQLSTAYQHSQATHAPSNAEANVQADWNEADTTSDAYIQNKPTNLATIDDIQRIDTDINKLFEFAELPPMLQKEVNAYGYYEHDGYLRVNASNELFFYIDGSEHCITTSAIRCSEGDVFEYFGVSSANIVGWAFLDDNKQVISWDNNHCNDYLGAKELVTIPAGVSYVVFSSRAKVGKNVVIDINYVKGNTVSSKLNTKLDILTNLVDESNVCHYPNLFDKTKVTAGYINTGGSIVESTTYCISDYILCKKGKTYTLSPKVRTIAYYDLDKNFILCDDTSKNEPYTFTVESDCYMLFSIYKKTLNEFMVEEGETNTSYKPYELTLKDEVCFNALQKEYIGSMAGGASGNVLFGKKLVTCGDSFTAGDFTGVTDENGLSGTASPVFYDTVRGCYKTYPWWIAERNNMTLVNEAKSGTTLTYLPDYTDAFSETRYQNIPADADYILIKIGINDDNNHKNAPIGTIEDTTNETFYGAWNVVLEYLITNHPWAKIGIIVTNGCNANYATAIRESAKRWGIPYLDEAYGENVPLLIRSNKSYVCAKAIELRDNQMKLSDENKHPNVKTHEYESTIVENFLRSL